MSAMSPEALRVAAARQRLTATWAALQARLAPKALAQDAVQSAVDKGQQLAADGVETARRHPAAATGALAAIGLLLFRRPLLRLVTRGGGDDATPTPPASLTPRVRRQARPPAAARGTST